MEHRFNLTLTREYYAESFDQMTRYGSLWRKVEYFLVVFFFAVAAWCFSVGETGAGVMIVLIGIYEFFAPLIKKSAWLKVHMKEESADSEVEILLNEQGLANLSKGPEGRFSWEGMWRVVNSPKGILLWPQKKMMIYLPKNDMGEEATDFVLSRCGKK